MTGGVGFTRDSTNQYRKNRELIKGITGKYFNRNTNKIKNRRRKRNVEASPELLEEIRKQTLLKSQKELIVKFSIAIVIIVSVIVYFLS